MPYSECQFTNADGTVLQISCLPVLFQQIIFWLLAFCGAVAIFFVIFAGIKFITSGGDPKQAEGARKTLTYAVIGLIVILISFGLLNFIATFTGVRPDCLTKFGFDNVACR